MDTFKSPNLMLLKRRLDSSDLMPQALSEAGRDSREVLLSLGRRRSRQASTVERVPFNPTGVSWNGMVGEEA